MTVNKYIDIVMVQGEEGRELTDKLYNVEGVVAHGVTSESINAMIEHLSQWETADSPATEAKEYPSWGSNDDIHTVGWYVLSANLGLGYVALARIEH